MKHKLAEFTDWPERAHAAGYCVKTLAQHFGVSPRTLERFFHERKGQSPHDWLHEERKRGAVEWLRKGLFVKETAAELGYEHAHHFSRNFKEHYGCCPSKLVLPLPDSVSKVALNAASRGWHELSRFGRFSCFTRR